MQISGINFCKSWESRANYLCTMMNHLVYFLRIWQFATCRFMRKRMVASSTIPITIFISLGLFYAFGIELNTVTLSALIVTLGMIVDNSIVIIDSYVEL